nr:MAG TPA: hypothetical protein [Bacteriophage sp.]
MILLNFSKVFSISASIFYGHFLLYFYRYKPLKRRKIWH